MANGRWENRLPFLFQHAAMNDIVNEDLIMNYFVNKNIILLKHSAVQVSFSKFWKAADWIFVRKDKQRFAKT